jgi:hypothetical protein
MNNLPSWIPNLRSWVNAIALILLVIALQYAIVYIILFFLTVFPHIPWLIRCFSLFALLFPVIAIAFLHHWLHQFLDSAFPESKVSVEEAKGFFPGLFSWWQGLYGWFVNTFSAYILYYLKGIFLPAIFIMNWTVTPNRSLDRATLPLLLAQIVIAAFLYQIEYLVHRQIIAAGKR